MPFASPNCETTEREEKSLYTWFLEFPLTGTFTVVELVGSLPAHSAVSKSYNHPPVGNPFYLIRQIAALPQTLVCSPHCLGLFR